MHRRVSFSARTNVTIERTSSNSSDVMAHSDNDENRRISRWKFVLTNTGNAFDAHSGIVTSPYTATYTFLVNVTPTGRSRRRSECGAVAGVQLVQDGRSVASITTVHAEEEQTNVVTSSYSADVMRDEGLWCELERPILPKTRRCRYEVTFRGFTE